VPIVVTGFEPLDLLQGLHMVLTALEEGRTGVENQYRRSVRREGNVPAQRLLDRFLSLATGSGRASALFRRAAYV